MAGFADYAAQVLGVRVPEDYSGFMDTYGKRLSDDPVQEQSWIGGLGSPQFVVGTTKAFRSMLPGFRRERLVIGYLGIKTIIVNRTYEDIDEYVVLDTGDGTLLKVDSLGAANKLAKNFEEWITPDLLRANLREKHASNLSVIIFDDELKAEEARLKLLQLKREGFIDLEDVVVVVKEQDGQLRYHQMQRQTLKGGFAGSFTGFMVGSLLFGPLAGAVLGAVAGALSAKAIDVGIEDQFVKDLSEKFLPGCSALFTLVEKADPERVSEVFLGFGGKVLVNSVSKERQAAIQAILDGTAEETKE
ncbi:MAG: DUF1269 domain-containing protein [Acidobacteriota bacterium]